MSKNNKRGKKSSNSKHPAKTPYFQRASKKTQPACLAESPAAEVLHLETTAPSGISDNQNNRKPSVNYSSMTPQRSIKATGLSTTVQIDDLVVFAVPGKKQASVVAESYDDYHNYTKGKFETAPITEQSKSKYAVVKSLYPDPKRQKDDTSPIAIADDPRRYGKNRGDDLSNNGVRQDQLREKGVLELRFFGQQFPSDTLHIQLIHNILDIDKILSPYINNIIVSLNRINSKVSDYSDPGDEETANNASTAASQILAKQDFIGNFFLPNSYSYFSGVSESEFDSGNLAWRKLLIQRDQFEDFICNPRMNYFSNVLFSKELGDILQKDVKTAEEAKTELAQRKKTYSILWLIALARHSMAHSNNQRDTLFLLDRDPDDEVWSTFYDGFSKDHGIKQAIHEARSTLDEIYSEKIKSFNASFPERAKRNVAILAAALDGEETVEQIAREYYAFAEQKQHRNTGYSIRFLRELLIRTDITNEKPSSKKVILNAFSNDEAALKRVLHKLDTVLDFIIWRYYTGGADTDENGLPTHPTKREENFIYRLRGASLHKNDFKVGDVGDVLFNTPDEDILWLEAQRKKHPTGKEVEREKLENVLDEILTKRNIYLEEAANVWRSIYSKVQIVLNNMGPDSFKKKVKSFKADIQMDDGDNDHYFSKLMYLLTLFLEGKEINILLTQLASKFDNIAGFMDLLEQLKNEQLVQGENYPDFLPQYSLFKDSRAIAKELRKVNSIARMGKADKAVSMCPLFIDATRLLGWTGDEDSLSAFLNDYLDPETLNQYNELVQVGSDSAEKEAEQLFKTSGYQNYLTYNVINNRRFRYLIRNGNPKELKAIAKNTALVSFVLSGLPVTQLQKNYSNYTGETTDDVQVMVDFLAEHLSQFSPAELADIQASKKASAEQSQQAEKKKMFASLYMTVLYQIIKNLVDINSRYFLGFHMVERDADLLRIKLTDYTKLTEAALSRPAVTKSEIRFHRYLGRNVIDQSAVFAINKFRNDVEHLCIIRALCDYCASVTAVPSYYALYHFLMQKRLTDVYHVKQSFAARYLNESDSPYSKKAVKLLCYPFAYNLARYKNLSIEELFSRHTDKDTDTRKLAFDDPSPAKPEQVPANLYYRTTAEQLPSYGWIEPGTVDSRCRNEDDSPARRLTTFYQFNRRIIGSYIRLTVQPSSKAHKDGKTPKVYHVDSKKALNNGQREIAFYKDDDGAWYIEAIPCDCLTLYIPT